jgi:glycosyltransferase involved in cell wall biosynthesis
MPIAYSPVLGEVARELREMSVQVVDKLDQLAKPPDLIHGQHHEETMTALLHFPGVPAVFFSHGWQEIPPRFPRLHRYVAVDQNCYEWLVKDQEIPAERVRVILNFVDLQRFHPRPPLPSKPRRALVFSNYMRDGEHLEPIRTACARAGIKLDIVGQGAGHPAARPEAILGQYDLVFAKARCALEALAVGAAVVLCDTTGVGPMVTTDGFDHLRQYNFGIRTLRNKFQTEVLAREIARYDATDASAVSQKIRETASLEKTTDEIIALYSEVRAAHAVTTGEDVLAEGRAAAAYVRLMTTHAKQERAALIEKYENTTTIRLSKRLMRIPLLGALARSMARKAVSATLS